jgi:glycosyltransferase involved in cell wall biosynthesis
MKKRILHLITGLEVGGAETMLLKILPQTKDVVDHHVCSIIGVGPIGDKLSSAGIPVHHLDLTHSLALSVAAYRLKNIINEIKPDVLITYLPHADLLGRIVGKATGIKTIVGSVRVRLTKSKYLPFFIFDGLTSPLVNHYHFNSRTIANLHRRLLFVSPKKITVIPNAIDVTKYDIQIDTTNKKKELGIPTDKVIIGCVARLRKQKGHPVLLSAFQQVVRKHPDTMLVLAGDGEEKRNIVKTVRKLNLRNNVIMLGNRHDVPEILQVFDIFAVTTLYEGMSNSIMEAMAAHRAIVTTDIPENRELITHNSTGLLVPVRQASATADALIDLIQDQPKRKKLGDEAYKSVLNKFSLEAIVPRYKEFYLSL